MSNPTLDPADIAAALPAAVDQIQAFGRRLTDKIVASGDVELMELWEDFLRGFQNFAAGIVAASSELRNTTKGA